MTFDREQTIARATKAALTHAPEIPAGLLEYARIVAIASPVIVRAVTDEIRALHERVEKHGRGIDINDQFTRQVTWSICGECSQPWPCSTVRLCDQIDRLAGVER